MKNWPKVLKVVGSLLIVLGSLDPLEGSVLILPGTGLVAGGTWLGHEDPRLVREWWWLFAFMAFGVIQLFELSAFGGIGGKEGHSWWWGVLILPYVGGWILALARTLTTAFLWIRSLWRRRRNPSSPATTS